MAESRAMRLGLVSDVYIETLPLDPLVSPVGRIYGIEGGVSLRYVGSKGLVTFATTHDLRAYQKRLGYTAENIDNKKVDFSDIDNTSYPTTKATVDYTEPLFEMKWNIDWIVTPFLLSVLGHIENVDLHVSSIDKSNWNSHVNNSGIHISSIERAEWDGKQNKLTAGDNVTISEDTISAKDTTYTASDFDIKDIADDDGLRSIWGGKQNKLTAGTNISIEDNTISAKDTTYKDSDFDIKDLADSTNLRSTWGGKQDTLTFSTSIETDKESTTKISAIKTFYDWAVGKFIQLSKIVTTWTATTLDTNVPSEKLVKDSLDLKAEVIIIENTVASTWVADTTYPYFNYKSEITISGLLATDIVDVVFAHEQAVSNNYSPICLVGANILTIYSKINTSITIPLITITR